MPIPSTTTIRLPVALKARVVRLAKLNDLSPHNFIVSAVLEKAAREEQRAALRQLADKRYNQIVQSGKTVSWDEMTAHLLGGGNEQKATPRKRTANSRK
jgi:predicted transcriptional regulator